MRLSKVESKCGKIQLRLCPNDKIPPVNSLASFSWGALPILSLITSLSLGSQRVWPVQAEKILRGVYVIHRRFDSIGAIVLVLPNHR